ncbi:MAG: hypothetical protein HY303_15580, partial [Candidatus Wallbacteria bacterium]|nr:hypothetical protein [Candidatus Wallbacteria bacterium]
MSSALRVAPTRSRIPLLVFGLTVAISAATAWPAAAKEETGEPVEFDRQVRFVSTSTVNDALTGDIDGRLYAESRGTRVLAAQRKGYSIDTLEAADFGGGKLLVAGWVSGGKARYLIPEVFKVVESGGAGTRLVKVWGPFEEKPPYEGDMRIEEKAGKSRLIVEDSLVYHNFVAPHLRRTTIWSWKGDSLEAGESTYGEPTSAYQKSNLAYEFYTRGNHKKSLRL